MISSKLVDEAGSAVNRALIGLVRDGIPADKRIESEPSIHQIADMIFNNRKTIFTVEGRQIITLSKNSCFAMTVIARDYNSDTDSIIFDLDIAPCSQLKKLCLIDGWTSVTISLSIEVHWNEKEDEPCSEIYSIELHRYRESMQTFKNNNWE